ncbi:MAG: hypothetical protein ACTHMI_01640 [Mucilaginibacter sp.]
MKKLLKTYSSLLLLCLLINPIGLHGAVTLQTAKKRIVKTYIDLKNERLAINNQYGNVVVKTWHQQKILVVITLTAHAITFTTANKLFMRVNIASDRNENLISVASIITKPVTPLPAGTIHQKKSTPADAVAKEKPLPKDGCNIDYEVFLPSGTSLSILNKFGNITMGDYIGAVDLQNKFGNIRGGNFTGTSTLTVEQGDIELKHANNTNLRAKAFGNIKIGSLKGKINGTFSSGNLLDINLSGKTDSAIIDADNVQQINLRGVAATNADFNIKTILSKFTNKSTLQFKELANNERKPQSKTGVDSLTTLLKNKNGLQHGSVTDLTLQKKKLQATVISQLKKLREYEGSSRNGKGKISVKIAFSSLNIFN